VQQALAWGAARLGQASTTPLLDAQVLLAHAVGARRVALCADYSRRLADEEGLRFRALVDRRLTGEPVAYLTGVREFWSLPLRVDRRALVPRPDTETVLEEVMALFPAAPPRLFADVGTGSGCLAVALAGMFPRSRGWAIDLDEAALSLAQENVRALGLEARLVCLLGDLLQPLPEPVELIVSNPPYIPTAEIPWLPIDVRGFEPLRALDGGVDGLELIQRLIREASGKLSPGGWLVLEVGDGQASRVTEILRHAGWPEVRTRKDLGGIGRVVAARAGEGP